MSIETFPLGIDLHVHFRTPGSGSKETLDTGYKAAISGGIGTVIDMPNTTPVIDSLIQLESKLELLEDYPFVHQFSALTSRNIKNGQLDKISRVNPLFKVFMANSTGDLGISRSELRDGLDQIEEYSPLVFFHAEDQTLILPRNNGITELECRPPEAEIQETEFLVDLSKEYPSIMFHITHVSTSQAAELLYRSKLSWDVLHKHLWFDETLVKSKGNYAKMNPPLRSAQDREILVEFLASGKVPIVTSDHAPHTIVDKRDPVAGAPGVQELYISMLDLYVRGLITKEIVTKTLYDNPKKILEKYNLNVRRGSIAFDTEDRFRFHADQIMSKSGWSLWENYEFSGKIFNIELD